MTMKEIWAKVNEEKTARFICYLYDRWQDEHEYEDIMEYLEAVKRHVPDAYKMTKRPFGFKAKASDGEISVKLKASGKYLRFTAEMSAA